MEDFKNISLEELENFKGSICLYSLDLENSLGDNVKTIYGKLFSNNLISYNSSLASETMDDLIIIDGDDFNPSKVFGLTKKYIQPIVIFVSNDSKLEKLKNILLRNILLVKKNPLIAVDLTENIKNNIEAKRLKDIERGVIQEDIAEQVAVETILVDSSEITNNGEIVILEDGKEAIVIDSSKPDIKETINEPKEERDVTAILESFKKENEIKTIKTDYLDNENIEKNTKEDTKKDINEDIKKDINEDIKIVTKEDKLKDSFNKDLKSNIKIDSIGVFGLSIDTVQRFKEIYPNIKTLKPNSDETYNAYIIDVSFATNRIYTFIEGIMPKPLILMSSFPEKIKELRYLNLSNILIIEKPLRLPIDELKKLVIDYFNSYDIKIEKEKIEIFNNAYIPKGLSDDKVKNDIRKKYNEHAKSAEYQKNANEKNLQDKESLSKEDKIYQRKSDENLVGEKLKELNKQSIEDAKQAINKANQRKDKDLSLSELYEKLGLNELSIFNTLINKEVYSTFDGKVIKYKPDGYLIEIRLERLKNRGLSEKEINSAMQRMEEADIRFERKQLRRIEVYNLNKNKVK